MIVFPELIESNDRQKGMYGIFPKMLVRQEGNDSTIDPIGRKYLGKTEFNRDDLLHAASCLL
jgi:hypothetical protein